jgi:hypothetical protein
MQDGTTSEVDGAVGKAPEFENVDTVVCRQFSWKCAMGAVEWLAAIVLGGMLAQAFDSPGAPKFALSVVGLITVGCAWLILTGWADRRSRESGS